MTERPNFEALHKAVKSSYRAMEPFRTLNQRLVEEYTGPAYGSQGKRKREKYFNKLNQAVDAYTMMLAANRPRVEISTEKKDLQPFANHFSVAMNSFIEEIHLEETLRRWVLDAFFCVGIIKCHMADSREVEIEPDLWMDPGMPFASNVSLDNAVLDMHASKPSAMTFAGDMYRLPFDEVQQGAEEGVYDPEVAKDLKPTSKYSGGGERLDSIARGHDTDDDEYVPMIDLVDIWLKKENAIYTFPVSDRNHLTVKGQPLSVMEWHDPEHSPYHILGFNDVPESVLPISPATHLISFERLINNVMRKQARKSGRQKEVHTYTASDPDGAKRIKMAGDGDMVQVNDPRDHGVIATTGIDPNLQAYLTTTLQHFDDQAGNLTALLGLGPQAKTVGQEQMIHQAGNRKIGQMQARVVEGTKGVLRTLGLMLWEDEFKEIVNTIPIQGAEDYKMTLHWRPGEREGNFWDYNFDINIYSMSYRPPAAQAEMINQLLTQIILPSQQMLMQQGGTINYAALIEMYASMLDIPKLRDIISFGQDLRMDQPHTSVPGAGKPNVSTRNYVRENVSHNETNNHEAQDWSDLSAAQGGNEMIQPAMNGAAY